MFRAKIHRREVTSDKGSSIMQKLEYFFVVSGSERSNTFRVLLNALTTLDTLVRDTLTNHNLQSAIRLKA